MPRQNGTRVGVSRKAPQPLPGNVRVVRTTDDNGATLGEESQHCAVKFGGMFELGPVAAPIED